MSNQGRGGIEVDIPAGIENHAKVVTSESDGRAVDHVAAILYGHTSEITAFGKVDRFSEEGAKRNGDGSDSMK